MLNPSSTLVVTLIALPAILAQTTNTTNANATAATPTAPTSNATFAPTTFTPVLATSTSCGSAQQNFNQCITKVGKDISSCTDNVCLCQTYANIAACYNGCPDLSSQGEAYQAQSTQFCDIAGVKPNATASTSSLPTITNTTSTTQSTSNTTPVTTPTTSNASTNANTFSAAKGSASSISSDSLTSLFAASAAALFAFAA